MDGASLGTIIRDRRKKMGLSQADVAGYLSIDQSYLSKMEKGERPFGISILEQLSELFCLPLESLLNPAEAAPSAILSYRTDSCSGEDIEQIAKINRLVLNLQQMEGLARTR